MLMFGMIPWLLTTVMPGSLVIVVVSAFNFRMKCSGVVEANTIIQESKRPYCLKLICYSEQAVTVKISFTQKFRVFLQVK